MSRPSSRTRRPTRSVAKLPSLSCEPRANGRPGLFSQNRLQGRGRKGLFRYGFRFLRRLDCGRERRLVGGRYQLPSKRRQQSVARQSRAILAVGDKNFKNKCRERVQAIRDSGTTIVFVSHDLDLVNSLCERVLLLNKGRMVVKDFSNKVIDHYLTQIVDDEIDILIDRIGDDDLE